MEQEPTPIIELFILILYLGSITFLLGSIYQGIVLYKNKQSILKSAVVIMLTRILTISCTFIFWALSHLSLDFILKVIFLPAVLPELILSTLILKIFGNDIFGRKNVA